MVVFFPVLSEERPEEGSCAVVSLSVVLCEVLKLSLTVSSVVKCFGHH